jgi:hypothetical protein
LYQNLWNKIRCYALLTEKCQRAALAALRTTREHYTVNSIRQVFKFRRQFRTEHFKNIGLQHMM